MTTRVGNLRRRYSVKGRSDTRNAKGELENSYTHKFYIWGESPREGTASLRAEAGTVRSEDSLRLRARYRSGIEIGDQLVDSGTVLYVRSVLDLDGRRNYLQITAALSPGGAG